MSFDEDPVAERMRRMPLTVLICSAIGACLGAIPGAVVMSHVRPMRLAALLFLLLAGGGFVIGIVVGVTLDTFVFEPRRAKEEKRRRRRWRRQYAKDRELEEEARERLRRTERGR